MPVINAKYRSSARDYYTWEGTGVKDLSVLEDRELMKKLLFRMMESRMFEEKVLDLFHQGKISGTLHLSVGEEGAAIGSTAALKENDCIFASHRGHSQVIGKGLEIRAMMCEMLSRENGTNHGRGGSMHLADAEKGVLCANSILGASAPLSCGAALAMQLSHSEDSVVVDFFGDGASNQGAVHESMNLAAAWNLPVMFVIFNNMYGFSTPLERAVNDTDLAKRGIPYGIKTFECDGNDVLSVYETVCEARKWIVTRKEPAFVVEHTYRTSGHSKSDKNLYRSQEEIDLWVSRSPTERFRKVLLDHNVFSEEEISEIEAEAASAIEDAVAFAEASPEPLPGHLMDNVYAD